ncbi:SusC/RagA family TonB-linked outer membrane protein [uncultured Tenacibaculum sp.]|uniref:SusC/RagA family TonB-linked outer membrane protein n=1 Tax=uncultured Tenacibaculum sp. TaxID=174713 RepID=UPI0026064AB1|nr:SusC/RagA family TonB-linked outer membrane protein [uncultured Tenacibaculum sp.]
MLTLLAQVTFAQNVTVSGLVSDKDGPLPGVTILVKGTTRGVETDFDGNYSISVSKGKTLIYSFIGMKTAERVVGDVETINVYLEEELDLLDEVVVTGLTVTDRKIFTGAAKTLKAEEIKLDGVPNISRALEGRAAGVTVQNVSGTFGTAPKIRIRGATSILGGSRPLWVIDGVILEDLIQVSADDLSSGDATTLISSAVAGLNADDIESFEVLKDGSATSVYGARAKGGVIVITTKKGRSGISTFNYTNESTFRFIPSYNDFNLMNSQEQLSVYEEMRRGGWLTQASVFNGSESGIYRTLYENFYTLDSNGNFVVKNNGQGIAEFLRQAEYRNTDWFSELFVANVMQNHSMSFSSGTEKASYYGSVSALVDPGWTKSSNVNRYTANFNSNFKLSDRFTINTISNASIRSQRAPGTLSRDIDIVSGEVKRDFDINPYSFALNSSRTLDPKTIYTSNFADFNILKELEENYIDLSAVNMRFQTELKYDITPELEISALGAIKYQTSTQEHHSTEFSNQANAYRAGTDPINTLVRDSNPFLYTDPDNPFAQPISVLPEGGIYRRTDYETVGYDFRSTLSYKNLFNDIHTINAYVGMQSNSVDRSISNFTGWGLQYSLGEVPFYNFELFKKGVEENNLYYGVNNTRERNLAFFSNLTYSWDKKYTVTGTVRYEGTNRLGKSTQSRWLPTWNVSGSWNAHRESFFDDLRPTLNRLTLKGSYSLTADVGPFNITNSLAVIRSTNPWRPISSVKESALFIDELENSNLTYEKKHELNLGFDAGLFDDRITLGLDWYKRDNFDLIGPITTQGIGGQVNKFGNIAELKSDGLEFSLSTVNIKTDKFSWTTDFVYAKAQNEVTKLDNNSRVIDLVAGTGFARQGYPVRSIFSIPFNGLNDEGLPTFTNENGETTVFDVNLQERDNVDFLEYSGSVDPTDTGSLNNTFTYGGFSLNVFATYSFGNVVRLDPIFDSQYSDLTAFPKEFEDRWIVPGDENFTNIPVIATRLQEQNYGAFNLATAYNLYNYTDERVAKGDFIRLKQISLGYQFNKDLVENLNLSSLAIKLQATNLFLLYSDDKLRGQDPEFFRSGGVSAPIARQITFTLRLGI